MNKMKPFLFLLIGAIFSCFTLAGHQPAWAAEAQQVQQIEAELKALRQMTAEQDEKIQALEQRVSTQKRALSAPKTTPHPGDKYTDDGQVKIDSGNLPRGEADQQGE